MNAGALDRLGWIVLDAGAAAWAWCGLAALAMVLCRQPAWRREWARAALVGALLIGPFVLLRSLDRPTEQLAWHGVPARTFVWVYLGGLAPGLAWFGLTGLAARRMRGRLIAPSTAARAVLRALAFPRRWDRPRLMVDPNGRRPALLGSFRPIIVIPPELDDPDQVEALRWALRHELAHAADHDPRFERIGVLAQAVWFFVLPIFWVRRRMRTDQEFLADRAAALRPWREPWQYAATLVAVAAGHGRALDTPPVLAASPHPDRTPEIDTFHAGSPLLVRVGMLLRCPFGLEPRPPAWSRCGLALVMVAGTTLASTLNVRAVERLWGPGKQAGATIPHGRLVMAGLTIRKPEPGDHAAVTLPPSLPDQFDLTLDVFATSKELNDWELAGCRLGAPARDSASTSSANGLAWHTIHLVRREQSVTAWIDARPVACRMTANPGNRLSLRFVWDHETPIRNLTLIW